MISAPLFGVRRLQVWGCMQNDLPEDGERQPQKENKLEDKVEGEPINNVDEALHDSEEGENDPVLCARVSCLDLMSWEREHAQSTTEYHPWWWW